jgi:alpha-tubulin suppressor-like RCC1 family protein
MNRKTISIFVVLLMICLLAAPLSASATYAGDHPLMTALHGTDTGNLIFQVGGSYDSDTASFTVSGIPAGATVTTARLYYYYCWNTNGTDATATATLNSQTVPELAVYSDRAGPTSQYDYPSGTFVFDATSLVAATGNGAYSAAVSHAGGITNEIGLLVIYHDPNGAPFEYWVNDGCDIVYEDGNTTTASFPGSIDTSEVSSARLIACVPNGDQTEDSLSFNSATWPNVCAPYVEEDVSSDLLSSGNSCTFTDTGDYMVPSNAILAVYYQSGYQPVDSNAYLSGLTVSGGALSPSFSPDTTSYTDSVNYAVSSITVTPAVTDPLSTVTVNGTVVTSGSASQAISLAVGDNTINVVVTAPDGTTTRTYTIDVTRVDMLSALTVSSGTLSPAFATTITSYTDSVPYTVSSITVTPTANDTSAIITVNGTAVASGSASEPISLNVGANTVTIVVTSSDGVSVKTNTLVVTRQGDANLSGLTLSSGTLTPVFATTTTSYTATVANSLDSITVIPTADDSSATITVNGTAVASGSASQAITLSVGANTVTILVTAADGITTKTYTVTVTSASNTPLWTSRIAGGYAHSLALKSDGTVVAWGQNTYGQTTVPTGLTGVAAIAAGGYHSLALKNDSTVVAWGQNTYGQTTVPTGLTGVVAIAAGLYHSLALKSDGTVAAWGNDGNNQCDVPSGLTGVVAIAAGYYHSLALKSDGTVVGWGYNNCGQCTAPSGLTNVVAIAAGDYHSLALKSDGTVVGWGYDSYHQCDVPSSLTGVTAIAAGMYHSLALKSDGTVVAWGYNSSGQATVPTGLTNVVAIAAGRNHSLALESNGTVVAWGFNGSGQTKVPAGLNLANLLSGLTLSSGTLTPAFASGTFSYTASVANSVASIDVTPTAYSGVSISVDGAATVSGSVYTVPLNVGDNTITIIAGTADGLTDTYTVVVTRAAPPASTDATLSALTVSGGTLTPTFAAGATAYTATVGSSVTSLTVTPTANESHATITVNGQAVTSGSASQAIPLSVGSNTVTIIVTAQDGTTTDTYTVTVTRLSGSTSSYAFDGLPLKVISSHTFNGTLLVDGGHGLVATPYTQSFQVPAGSIGWARLYVGVWGGTQADSGALGVNFNGASLGTVGIGQNQDPGPASLVDGSGNGVWWVAIDVTGDVIPGSANNATLNSTATTSGYDGRIYGAVLVAEVDQDGGPTVSYQVAEGNECLNYVTPNNAYSLSLNFPAGSLPAGDIGKADLTTVYLTGHKGTADDLSLNGTQISSDAMDGSGTSLDGTTWTDRYFGLHDWDVTGLTAQKNTVSYQRGAETYISPVLAILTTQASSDASLSGLTLSSGALTPDFTPGTTGYTASVANAGDSITVTPTADESHAAITVNGTAVASGSASDPVSLAVGDNVITIVVTAQDGTTTDTYTVTVTRAASSSGGYVTSTTGSATVDPGYGGSISTQDAAAGVSIPADAINGSTPVTVAVYAVTNPPAATGFQVLGSVYDFSVGGESYAFAKDVTLTFALSNVPPGDTPCVYWYDGSTWKNLGGTVSSDGTTISVDVDHFSEFTVGVATNNYGVESFPILSAKPSYFEAIE